MRHNRIRDGFSGGVFVGDVARRTIVENNAVDNQIGLPAFESDGDETVIRRNASTNSVFPGAGNYGVQVDSRARNNRVEANTIDQAGSISIGDSGRRTLIRATASPPCASAATHRPDSTAASSCATRRGAGQVVGNVVRRLAVTGGAEPGAGIQISGDGIAVVDNVVSEIDFAGGIRVEPEAAGTLLRANVANRADDEGSMWTAAIRP